jgi:hypothetical protein
MPELDAFPKAHQVTFKYYVGVILFLEENYVQVSYWRLFYFALTDELYRLRRILQKLGNCVTFMHSETKSMFHPNPSTGVILSSSFCTHMANSPCGKAHPYVPYPVSPPNNPHITYASSSGTLSPFTEAVSSLV